MPAGVFPACEGEPLAGVQGTFAATLLPEDKLNAEAFVIEENGNGATGN